MTIDERVEFLTQSIKTHDRQIGETVENIDRLTGKLDSLTMKLDSLTVKVESLTVRVDKLAETTQLNFDRLSTAMLGLTLHAIDHQRRIEQLER